MIVAAVKVSLPKTRFVRIDGVVRQGPDTRQCARTVRRAVCRARPYRAKRGSEPHCNRSRISRGFAEGALVLEAALHRDLSLRTVLHRAPSQDGRAVAEPDRAARPSDARVL